MLKWACEQCRWGSALGLTEKVVSDTEMEEKRDKQRGMGTESFGWRTGCSMSWFERNKSHELHSSLNFIPEIPGLTLGYKLDVILIKFFGIFVCLLFFGHLDTNWVILAEDVSIDWPVGKSVGVFSSLMFDREGPGYWGHCTCRQGSWEM